MSKADALEKRVFADPGFQENCYVLWVRGETAALVVDPGFAPTPIRVAVELEQHKLSEVTILLTHCHVDHIAGVDAVRAIRPDAAVLAPRDEAALLEDPFENLSAMMGMPITLKPADRWLAPGDTLSSGSIKLRAVDVAGHSPGGLAYVCDDLGFALVGDAVFEEGYGRTDFPHSDHKRLIRNIRDHLLSLPGTMRLLPGHFDEITVARVIRENRSLAHEIDKL